MEVLVNSTSIPNELEGLKLDSVKIFGLSKQPKSISVGSVNYNNDTKVAELSNLNQPMTNNWEIFISF